jgi:hypothetical protein
VRWTLITVQQSGPALGVATLYLALEPHGISHAFAAAVAVQFGIVVLSGTLRFSPTPWM